MELYRKYIKELENSELIQDPHGFITYKIYGKICMIVDIYVEPEFRKENIASKMADEVTKIAKEKGCEYLEAHVWTTANNPSLSASVILAYGFKILTTELNKIIFMKEI